MKYENYCTYNQAIKLKESGFYWPCTHLYFVGGVETLHDWSKYTHDDYNSHCDKYSAPTLSQAQKWLRDKKGLIISVTPRIYRTGPYSSIEFMGYRSDINDLSDFSMHPVGDGYETYEDALSYAIDYALDLKYNNKIN